MHLPVLPPCCPLALNSQPALMLLCMHVQPLAHLNSLPYTKGQITTDGLSCQKLFPTPHHSSLPHKLFSFSQAPHPAMQSLPVLPSFTLSMLCAQLFLIRHNFFHLPFHNPYKQAQTGRYFPCLHTIVCQPTLSFSPLVT